MILCTILVLKWLAQVLHMHTETVHLTTRLSVLLVILLCCLHHPKTSPTKVTRVAWLSYGLEYAKWSQIALNIY